MTKLYTLIHNELDMGVLSAMVATSQEMGLNMRTKGVAPNIGEVLEYDKETRTLSKATVAVPDNELLTAKQFGVQALGLLIDTLGPTDLINALMVIESNGGPGNVADVIAKIGRKAEGHNDDFILKVPEVFGPDERGLALGVCVKCVRKAALGDKKGLDHFMSDPRVMRVLLGHLLVSHGYAVRQEEGERVH